MHKANLETQQTAQDLTNALTYDNKHQGDWGEEILNSMLTGFGFREGVEFDTQKQYEKRNWRNIKPDVILHLPDEKISLLTQKSLLKIIKNICGRYIKRRSTGQTLLNQSKTRLKT